MLDSLIRPHLVSPLDNMAAKTLQSGLNANKLTLIGFLFGFAGCFLVGMQLYPLALVLILVALFFDGLDGAVARTAGPTELGAYLDMMSGVALFAMFPFFFMLSETEHSMAAAILLFTFLLMGMVLLAGAGRHLAARERDLQHRDQRPRFDAGRRPLGHPHRQHPPRCRLCGDPG